MEVSLLWVLLLLKIAYYTIKPTSAIYHLWSAVFAQFGQHWTILQCSLGICLFVVV